MQLRPAATIVVARAARRSGDPVGEATGGVEVVVVRRSSSSRFAPGFVVFPGGAVELGDEERAARWFGAADERARAAAVRELAEEASLVPTATGVAVGDVGVLLEASFVPPPPNGLPEIARWIAPDSLPVRFDARFFALACHAADADPRPDGTEAEAAWWARPADVLEAAHADETPLMWPTLRMLEALVACDTVADVAALRVAQVAPADVRPS